MCGIEILVLIIRSVSAGCNYDVQEDVGLLTGSSTLNVRAYSRHGQPSKSRPASFLQAELSTSHATPGGSAEKLHVTAKFWVVSFETFVRGRACCTSVPGEHMGYQCDNPSGVLPLEVFWRVWVHGCASLIASQLYSFKWKLSRKYRFSPGQCGLQHRLVLISVHGLAGCGARRTSREVLRDSLVYPFCL